jgi:hypothetical protein
MYPNPLSADTDVSVADTEINQVQLELNSFKVFLGSIPCILSDDKDIPQLVFPLTTSDNCDDAALMIAAQAITPLDDPRRAREWACVQATKWHYSLPAFSSHVAMGWLRVNKWRRGGHGHTFT